MNLFLASSGFMRTRELTRHVGSFLRNRKSKKQHSAYPELPHTPCIDGTGYTLICVGKEHFKSELESTRYTDNVKEQPTGEN